MPLGSWPSYSNDTGTGQDGTVGDAAFFNAIRASIEGTVFGVSNPSVGAAAIIDEVITARGSTGALNTRLSVALASTGVLNPFSPQPTFKPGSASVADGTTAGGINSQTSAVGNSGGGLTDLMSYSIQANHMDVNNKAIEMIAYGTIANNANSKTINVVLGATTVLTFNNTLADLNWQIYVLIQRLSSTTAKVLARIEQGPKTDAVITDNRLQLSTAAAVTWSGANTLKVQAQGVASNDIVQEGMVVKAVN